MVTSRLLVPFRRVGIEGVKDFSLWMIRSKPTALLEWHPARIQQTATK